MTKWTVIYQETIHRSTVYDVEADSRAEAIAKHETAPVKRSYEKEGDGWFDTYEHKEPQDEPA